VNLIPFSGLHTPTFALADCAFGAANAGLTVVSVMLGDCKSMAEPLLLELELGSGVLDPELISRFSNLLFSSLRIMLV